MLGRQLAGLQGAEQPLAAVDAEPAALGEPELHYGRGPAHGAGAVALAVQDADGTAGLGDVGGLEVQRLRMRRPVR